jgi:methylmalonyl-CoA/ethylmalonyl-CoA epimerase
MSYTSYIREGERTTGLNVKNINRGKKMVNKNLPLFEFKPVEQVCLVVRDVEKRMKLMWKTFGMGPWKYFTIDSHLNDEMFYYGKPTKFSMKVALLDAGGFELELIEPLDGESTYRDFLRDKGEGVHHFGHYNVKGLEAFYKTRDIMEEAGYPCVTSARIGGIAMGYFDTTKAINTMIELVAEDPATTLPFVMKTYPTNI